MRTGYVDRMWAQREHARWLTEDDAADGFSAPDSFSAPVSTSRRNTEDDTSRDTRR